jgi:hypothetical protein
MAPRKQVPESSDAVASDALKPVDFEADRQAWSKDLANGCVASARPAQDASEGARTGDDDPSKVKIPNPYPFRYDAQTGVILLEDRQLLKMQFKFDVKPSDEVRQTLRDAGFRWKSLHQTWELAIDKEAWTARIAADKIFQQVTDMIRQELGITREVP